LFFVYSLRLRYCNSA